MVKLKQHQLTQIQKMGHAANAKTVEMEETNLKGVVFVRITAGRTKDESLVAEDGKTMSINKKTARK